MRQRDRQSSGKHLAGGRNQGERENERRTSGQDEDKDEEETLNRDTQTEEKKSNFMTDFHCITQPSWQVISSSGESSSSRSSSRSLLL